VSDPVYDDPAALSLALARRVDEVCCRFEVVWTAAARGGSPPRLEEFLGELPDAARPTLLRELLKVETHHRRLSGDEPRVDDYCDRLPDLDAGWLAEVLADNDAPAGGMPAFLDALRRSGLLDPTKLGAAVERADAVRQPDDLAAWLLSRGWLTSYQVRLLLTGRPDELSLGEYRLLEPLGKGGMGWVFKARHRLMNRVVAVKRIRPEGVHDAATVRRFRVEMQAAARLNHPNVVVVHDAQEVDGCLFLVMEFCEGVTLYSLVGQRGPLPAEEACGYVRQACLGLQHASDRGLVHRDLKPDNLMLCGGAVKILDFGLARLRRGDAPPGSTTQDGMIVGTADYMAPEQSKGQADIRSDLYSLGCTLYFLLTGQTPFPGGSLLDKCVRHRTEEPVPLTRLRPDVPARVENLVRRLMAKNPADRFQTPAEAAAALEPLSRAHRPGQASQPRHDPVPLDQAAQTQQTLAPKFRKARSGPGRRTATVLGAVVVVVVCVAVILASRREPAPGAPVAHVTPETPETPPSSPRAWKKSSTLPIPPGQAATYGLAFSPDGRLLAATFGNNEDSGPKQLGQLCVWEADGGRLKLDREIESGPGTCVAFSPDGARLAWGAGYWNHEAPGHVTIWDVAGAAVVAHFEAHPKGVLGLAFQPRGDLLVTTGREGKVRVWDGKTGKPRGELKDAGVPVFALAFSPDGSRLAVGADDGTADLWDVGTRERVETLSPATWKPVRGLAFTADGGTILAATKRGQGTTANLLAWQGRKPLPTILLGETEAYCLALSPDRATALIGCQNKTAKLFQTATRQELQTLTNDRPFFCLAFSPTGRLLATSGGWSGPVELWEPADGP
jgi:serine/threonine protein kinase